MMKLKWLFNLHAVRCKYVWSATNPDVLSVPFCPNPWSKDARFSGHGNGGASNHGKLPCLEGVSFHVEDMSSCVEKRRIKTPSRTSPRDFRSDSVIHGGAQPHSFENGGSTSFSFCENRKPSGPEAGRRRAKRSAHGGEGLGALDSFSPQTSRQSSRVQDLSDGSHREESDSHPVWQKSLRNAGNLKFRRCPRGFAS